MKVLSFGGKIIAAFAALLMVNYATAQQPDSIEVTKKLDYSYQRMYIINDIKISGLSKNINENLMISNSGLMRGDTLYLPGSTHLADAVKRLWDERYFSDIKVLMQFIDSENVNIEIVVQPRPLVNQWLLEGVGKGQKSDLMDKLDLKRGSEMSEFTINRAINIIKKHFAEKGYHNTQVTVKEGETNEVLNMIDVTFVVDKGERVKIGEIQITGNSEVPTKKLLKAMKGTKAKNWNFFKSSKFKVDKYEEDKENIIDYYNSKGFRNAIILKDSIYQINEKRMGIKLELEEGNKFYFRDIKWIGNSAYDTYTLSAVLGILPGDLYDRKTMNKRLGIGKEADIDGTNVVAMYQNNGYMFSTIQPEETIVGKDSIDLEIKIIEGNQATINSVNITGNNRLNDHVIRRELYVRPGELYDRSLLMATYRQLMATKHFNPEAFNPDIRPVTGSDRLVDITFPLEEQASDQFQLSGGWGAGMFVGSIGVTLNNLSIGELFKKGAWRPYPSGNGQSLSLQAQTNGSYYKSIALSFTEPWLGGKKPNTFSTSVHYTEETNANYMWKDSEKHFRTIGFSAGIGKRLSWPDPYFQVYGEISYQSYNLKNWDYFIISNGSSHTISFRGTISRNTIDNPYFPRSGSEFSLSATLTPPYSLFDGKDYGGRALSDNKRYKLIEYHKWKFKYDWYYPLAANKLVLKASAQFGLLGAYNYHKQSPFEGFDVGGDGMSGYNVYGVEIIGLRGYDDSSITPVSSNGDYARAYNKYTLELRYPIVLQPASQIFALVFAEGGNAFQTIKKMNPFEVKRSAGVGVRLFLSVVGMLGLDWGYGFDVAPGTGKKGGSQLHFMIGQTF